MNKYGLAVCAFMIPSVGLAAYVGQSQVTPPTIDIERCNDPSYFGVYEAQADALIDAKFDESLDTVGADLQGANDVVADKVTTDMAAFLQASSDKCQHYLKTCSSANIKDVNSQLFIESFDTCLVNANRNVEYAMVSARANFIQNRQTLAELTIEENAKSMMARIRDTLQPLEMQVMAKLEQLESQVSGLIRQPWSIPGSQLQDT